MTDAAVKAAKAVDYVGAGTVEFIVDGSGKLRTDGFWFMEMNTRLQVEHPVTEMITGLDLVELQIRVAQGEKLSKQNDIKMEGHAVEARLYAEDPANDFLPSVGPLQIFDGFFGDIRVDSGVEEGDQISLYYDPMIAKFISHSESRKSAINTLAEACKFTSIFPIKSNVRFIFLCLTHSNFQAGNISTHFIESHGGMLANHEVKDNDIFEIARTLEVMGYPKNSHPFDELNGWRPNLPPRKEKVVYINSEETSIPISTNAISDGHISPWRVLPEGILITVENRPYLVSSNNNAEQQVLSADSITAPMPGKIIAVNAKAGDTVSAGDPLIIMEAMKMEMTLEAPRDGVVAEVTAQVDALVTDGEMLLSLEEIEKDK